MKRDLVIIDAKKMTELDRIRRQEMLARNTSIMTYLSIIDAAHDGAQSKRGVCGQHLLQLVGGGDWTTTTITHFWEGPGESTAEYKCMLAEKVVAMARASTPRWMVSVTFHVARHFAVVTH